MHLYLITRGIKHDVDRFINDLQAQYYPFKSKSKENLHVQLAVRPMQLWELVMPEDQLPSVQKMIFDKNTSIRKLHEVKLAVFRKMLGAKKIPKFDEKLPTRIIYKENIGLYPIGIKKDHYNEDHEEL